MRILVTGTAGFIGSTLSIRLLERGDEVIGVDNVNDYYYPSLKEVCLARLKKYENFTEVRISLEDKAAIDDVFSTYKPQKVVNLAAQAGVRYSLENPQAYIDANIVGFTNILEGCRHNNVKHLVYASSSSVYGNSKKTEKKETDPKKPISPYGISKLTFEKYAEIFSNFYKLKTVGIRFFNVFGPNQSMNGPYSAVIPKWIAAISNSKEVQINGDGETSRDFCFIDNAVQANILAATTQNEDSLNQVYNVAFGEKTSLNELFRMIKDQFLKLDENFDIKNPKYASFRQGDVRHSLANINKAKTLLGYEPQIQVSEGIEMTIKSYQVSAL